MQFSSLSVMLSLIFNFSLGIYGVQEHRATFDDYNEINDTPLRICPSITFRPMLLPCALNGLHQPLYMRFLTLQENNPQRVVAERFVAGD